MPVNKNIALENLKTAVACYTENSIKLIDSELIHVVHGDKRKIKLFNIFDELDRNNFILVSNVVDSLIRQYREAGWKVERTSDDHDGNVILIFE